MSETGPCNSFSHMLGSPPAPLPPQAQLNVCFDLADQAHSLIKQLH